jgi:hypothetical protein
MSKEITVSQIKPDRWLIQTMCHECFIDVESSNDAGWKWVSLNMLSSHQGQWEGRLRTRLSYAWKVLTGQGWPALELVTVEEVDALISTLIQARQKAFDTLIITESEMTHGT